MQGSYRQRAFGSLLIVTPAGVLSSLSLLHHSNDNQTAALSTDFTVLRHAVWGKDGLTGLRQSREECACFLTVVTVLLTECVQHQLFPCRYTDDVERNVDEHGGRAGDPVLEKQDLIDSRSPLFRFLSPFPGVAKGSADYHFDHQPQPIHDLEYDHAAASPISDTDTNLDRHYPIAGGGSTSLKNSIVPDLGGKTRGKTGGKVTVVNGPFV
jgi:hypothetical protein